MRVFSVEMLVKEEGAAVVEAALKRLKGEAAAVAAEMKVTTGAVTNTGKAMKRVADETEISRSRAAKAAIGFAAVGQSMARTGSLTADAGTRIIEAGSIIASMFGVKGIAVGALLGFGATAITMMNQTRKEIEETRKKFEEEVQKMANTGDAVVAATRIRDLELGVPAGALDSVVDANDGLAAMKARLEEIEKSPGRFFSRAIGKELEYLRKQIPETERQIERLRGAVFAPTPRGAIGATPVTVSAAAPRSTADMARQDEQSAAAFRAFDEAYYREAEKSFNQRFEDIEKLDEDFNKALADMMAQHAKDSADAFAYQFEQEQQRIADSAQSVLSNAISTGIEGGLTSGLQMALSGGNLQDSFKAMGQAITQSLASAMVKVALAAIKFGTLLENIKTFMMKHPALAVASAVAMLALARSMGGGASGADMIGTGGAGGLTYSAASSAAPTQQIIFGATSATSAAGMTPRQAMNVTIIGPNDPSAQRAMQELMAKANSRGRIG